MKKYNFKTRELREKDIKNGVLDIEAEKWLRKEAGKTGDWAPDLAPIISSEDFINNFIGYIEDIARFKNVKGRKFLRSTEYAAIGIMDINDIYQEAYLAFLESYAKFKELDEKGKFDYEDGERGAAIWTYLKKTTTLNFEIQIREKKDGVRVNQYQTFKNGGVNTNLLTSLFSQLEKVFANNEEEVSLTKWETDLVGAFLEVHMDEYLDLTRDGNRDFKKNERAILKALYGIDQPIMTYKELSEYYDISQSTIRSVKERAVKRLRSEESKEKIANFLHEYRINTKADTEKYRK